MESFWEISKREISGWTLHLLAGASFGSVGCLVRAHTMLPGFVWEVLLKILSAVLFLVCLVFLSWDTLVKAAGLVWIFALRNNTLRSLCGKQKKNILGKKRSLCGFYLHLLDHHFTGFTVYLLAEQKHRNQSDPTTPTSGDLLPSRI